MLTDVQKHILSVVADMASMPEGAVNIRSDGKKAYRHNTENIEIVSKTDKDGIDIRIAPFTKDESVHIPVILTKSGFKDMVYNDFFVGEGADVLVKKLAAMLGAAKRRVTLSIPYTKAGVVDMLKREAGIIRMEYTDAGIEAEAVVTPEILGRIKEFIPGYTEPREEWEDE